jgi:hypothetical protein
LIASGSPALTTSSGICGGSQDHTHSQISFSSTINRVSASVVFVCRIDSHMSAAEIKKSFHPKVGDLRCRNIEEAEYFM